MSAKIFTSLLVAGAMAASLSVATPAAALNQDQRNIVGGVVLGVLGTMAVKGHQQQQRARTRTAPAHHVCRNPYQTYRNGHLVTVCR